RVSRTLHVLHVTPQLRDPAADVLAVGLEFRLAGAARADPATEPAHRLAPAAEARQEIVGLRELDLRLALARVRVQGEDVEDERGAVDDLHVQPRLKRTQV